MQSMTGFGSAQKGPYRVDIRSLNSRYLEANFKMPSKLLAYEMDLRDRLKRSFQRGRFDVTISFTNDAKNLYMIDLSTLQEIDSSLKRLSQHLGYDRQPSFEALLSFKELFFKTPEETDSDSLFEAFELSLSALKEMRDREGNLLKQKIVESLEILKNCLKEIEDLASEVTRRSRDKIQKRLQQLIDIDSIDEARLYQEVAFMAQRADITEEITRLKSHLHQFSAELDREVVGKKLDFILQEILRETNTISQKSEELNTINLTIKMKAEIDRLKEQVQNIQ